MNTDQESIIGRMQATYMDAVSYCDHRPTAPLNHTIIFSITRLCSPTDGRTTVCEKLPYKYFCLHITNSLLCIGDSAEIRQNYTDSKNNVEMTT